MGIGPAGLSGKDPMTKALEKNIVRNTEKAMLIRCYDLRTGDHDVWFPLSQIEVGNKFVFLPDWLADAKARDSRKTLGFTDLHIAREIEQEVA